MRSRAGVCMRIERRGNGPVTAEVREDPREHCDWRHSKNWCPHYRERWFPHSDPALGEPMYQVFCLQNTPPTTLEEQEKCLVSRTRCWRLIQVEAHVRTQAAVSAHPELHAQTASSQDATSQPA